MLKVRIIPTLLWKDIGLVKGVAFDSWRRVDTVLPAIKVYNLREVDELILLDITATKEKRKPDYKTIKDFSGACYVPFAIGGGITTIEDIKMLLRSGADKVVINTAAYSDIGIISEGARIFGSQCIVASVDYKYHDGKYQCYSHNGQVKTGYDVFEWVKRLEGAGVGELIITSIERDGTMSGYDIELLEAVCKLTSVPIIASGGAGSYDDMYQAIEKAKVSAVSASSMFHFTERTPKEAKRFLEEHGIQVRQ